MIAWQRTSRAPGPRGFTLIELVVSIGVVAVIGVGLAAVFATVGKTVQTGRRVSALTETAAAFERQIRDDINNMARDGFLVIRNEWANGGDPIRLSTDDESPRPRRADELLFFRRGDFQSAREPVAPGVIARATQARVYYGHGQRFPEAPFAGGAWEYGQPSLAVTLSNTELGSNSVDAIGTVQELALGTPGTTIPNPNEFAGEWMLLRDVTLLAQPKVVSDPEARLRQDLTGNVISLDGARDYDIQYALQPAARSVFRSINTILDGLDTEDSVQNELVRPRDDDLALGFGTGAGLPWLESGLVDIATTDLSEIRTTVTRAANFIPPGMGGPAFVLPIAPSSIWDRDARAAAGGGTAVRAVEDLPWQASRAISALELATPAQYAAAVPTPQEYVQIQHAWMADALPGPSFETITEVNPSTFQTTLLPELAEDGTGSERFFERTRRRYEPEPPGFYRNLFEAGDPFDAQLLRSDKAMLTAANFAPRCTEFIVEWSFGEVGYALDDDSADVNIDYADGEPLDARAAVFPGQSPDIRVGRPGELVWYGAERYLSRDEANARGELAARPLPRGNPTDTGDPYADWRNNLATLVHGRQVMSYNDNAADAFDNSRRPQVDDLFVGGVSYTIDDPDDPNDRGHRQWPLTSFFGYEDPRNVDNNGDGSPDTTWPWPKFIRITATFADPNDPLIEETIQFVVEVPQATAF